MSRRIIRHYNAGCAVYAVAVVLLYFLVLKLLGAPFAATALLAFLLALAWVTLYYNSNKRLGAAAVHALEEDCDPEPLLELSREQLAARGKRWKARRPALTCRLNIATALICLGRDGEAMDELDELGGPLPPRPNRLHVEYDLSRSSVCFQLGRDREMNELLDRVQTLLETITLPQALSDSYQSVLRANRAAYRCLTEGPLPELEEYYRALLAQAATQRMKVGCHMTLGGFALVQGDEAEARVHLAYAVEHGNKLYYRAEAESLLAKLAPAPW